MTHIQRRIIALFLGLAIFFNIERLSYGEASFVNLASFVYILGLIVVISTITLPFLQRLSVSVSLILWIFIYFLGKLIIFNDRPTFGGIYSYLTTTEVTLLSLLILLTHSLARGLDDFKKAIANVTMADIASRVQLLNEAEEVIRTEMSRSRRYHRPLSVVVVDLTPASVRTALHRMVQEVQQALMMRYVFNSLARVIVDQIERIDLVLEQTEKNRFIILCPEKERAGLTETIHRIRTVAMDKLGIVVACGIASFPDEAVTFEGLVNQAEAHLDYSTKPVISLEVEAEQPSLPAALAVK